MEKGEAVHRGSLTFEGEARTWSERFSSPETTCYSQFRVGSKTREIFVLSGIHRLSVIQDANIFQERKNTPTARGSMKKRNPSFTSRKLVMNNGFLKHNEGQGI